MVEYGVQTDNKFNFDLGSDDELGDPSELLKLGAQEKKTPAQKKAEKEEARKARAKEEAARKAAAATAAANKENRPTAAGERGGRGRGRGGARGARGDGPRPPRVDRGDRPPRPERQEGDFPAKEGHQEGGFRGRGGRGRGGPFRGGRGGGAPRPVGDSSNADEHHKEVTDENTPPAFEGERSFRPRGGRGFGGGRGGRGGFRGSREFDRQSGSDRKEGEKKEGHGRGNWGTPKDELAATEEGENEAVKVEAEEKREKTAEELEQEALEAVLASQKTLAEYKASLQKDANKFNIRKANEGGQDNFGKLVPLTKKELHEEEHQQVLVAKESKKKLVDLDIRFADQGRGGGERAERGGRGGRGGGDRGPRGGRGGHFGGRGGGARPSRGHDGHFKADLANANEFPSLG